ncbi:MAG: glycosyltransferase [Gemmatimonadota bacterium]
MNTTLLIDAVNVISPGGLQLQAELMRMVASRRPLNWRVLFVTANDSVADVPEGIELLQLDRIEGLAGLWTWVTRKRHDLVRRTGTSVVYLLGGILSPGLARLCGTVSSINSMLPFAPEHVRHYSPLAKGRWRLLLLRRAYLYGSRLADAVVVPSEYAIDRLRVNGVDIEPKAFVAYNPVPEYVRYRPSSPPPHPYEKRPYFFYLSVVFWYKNHLQLIEGYRRAAASVPDLPDLLLAGPPADSEYVSLIQQAITRAGLEQRVRYLGFVEREMIPGWLHHATVNVFPSTCETNSFAQTEILGAHGVLACSNCPPMPEVAGPAAELFDPHDPNSIASALLRLGRDGARRDELRKLAAERAAELTAERGGEIVWKAVHHAFDAFRARRNGSGLLASFAGL